MRAWVDTDVDMTDFFTMGMPAVVDMLKASGARAVAGVIGVTSIAFGMLAVLDMLKASGRGWMLVYV